MRNSKKWIRALAVILFALVVLGLVDYAMYPCTFMRNDIHAIATNDYDDLYVGTSRGKMGIDPDAMEEVTGRSGHNACVGGEYTIDTYYMLKLAIEKGHAPKRLVYEASIGYVMNEKEEGNNYLLFFHEFPLSVSKLQYYLDAFGQTNIRTTFFPWYEYKLSYELKRLGKTIHTKWTGDYSAANLKSSTQEWHESGFIERYPVDEADFAEMNIKAFDSNEVMDINMEYLEKLIQLCQENGIEFAAISTPMPKVTLQAYADSFEEMDAYYGDFFEGCGVTYINFNNRTYYKRFNHQIENYTDYDGHMNGDAARSFSRVLAAVLEEEMNGR